MMRVHIRFRPILASYWRLGAMLSACAVGAIIMGPTVGGQSLPPRAGFQAVADQIAAAVRWELEDKQRPSVAIAVVDGDGILWADAFGYADRQRTRPATIDTLYRVGSVSKLFTDIAAMQLVEEGLLDLDEPIATYFPDFAVENPTPLPITLRLLMSHRSGLVRESPVGHYFDPTEPGLTETVLSLNRTALVYPPGARTKYSNAAIAMVGLIVERVVAAQRGDPGTFESIVRQRIFEPLGMQHSCFRLDDETRPLAVEGLMWSYDGREFTAPDFALGTLPAGNLYSSVTEQGRFIAALIRRGEFKGNRILQEATLQEMWRPQAAVAHGSEAPFGLGFAVAHWQGRRRVGHGGAVYGCATELAVLPDDQLGVIVVASRDCANNVVRRLADYALQATLAARANEPPPRFERSVPVGRRVALAAAGAYRRADGTSDEIAELFARGDELVLDQGVFRGRIRRHSDHLAVDDVLRSGPVSLHMEDHSIRINGVDYRRIADEAPPPMPAHFLGLVGEYGWDHNVLFIYERRGRLHALIEWFFDYPLTEIDSETFAFPDFGLYHGERLLFRRNEHGIADEVVAAEVRFSRRPGMSTDGKTFQIEPLRPIDELRAEALRASPPDEAREFRAPDLVDLAPLFETLKLEIRYAGANNFLGVPVYDEARAFLQRPAAEALGRAHHGLRQRGFGLLIYDAYRPWYVTRMFYDATPGAMKHFVANPLLGSRHNRGCAVDVTLYDLATGLPVEMVSGYDEFTERAYPDYYGPSQRARWHREVLRTAMEAEGFRVYEYEWWHFDFQDWQHYPILNHRFDALGR